MPTFSFTLSNREAFSSERYIEREQRTWSPLERFIFHIAAVFFVLEFVPVLDWHFWRTLSHMNLFHFQDAFHLATYIPRYFYAPQWGIASFRGVVLILALSVLGAAIWTGVRNRTEIEVVEYQWLRILVRYRLAIALIAYGVLQIIPVQFPKPTLSDLQTNYGDFLQWKLFYLSNGVATAWYGQALGLLEVLAGVLLLWDNATVFGAGIALALLGNITLTNFAYQLGNHILASELSAAAFFLLYHDLQRLFDLLVFHRRALADRLPHVSLGGRLEKLRGIAKAAVFVLTVLYTSEVVYAYKAKHWPFPSGRASLPNAAGVYDVPEFTVNGRTIPYSITDPIRWQNVVIEEWNTVSVRNNQPLTIAVSNPETDYSSDPNAYEIAGNGGRHFYSYAADPAQKTFVMQGRNDIQENIAFHYDYQLDGSLLLTGKDEKDNTLRVVLKKQNKQYLLLLGRRKALNIY